MEAAQTKVSDHDFQTGMRESDAVEEKPSDTATTTKKMTARGFRSSLAGGDVVQVESKLNKLNGGY
jgi:hypothetical protein